MVMNYEDSLLDATFGKASHAKSERDEKVKLWGGHQKDATQQEGEKVWQKFKVQL